LEKIKVQSIKVDSKMEITPAGDYRLIRITQEDKVIHLTMEQAKSLSQQLINRINRFK
jgi:hypothetical protein